MNIKLKGPIAPVNTKVSENGKNTVVISGGIKLSIAGPKNANDDYVPREYLVSWWNVSGESARFNSKENAVKHFHRMKVNPMERHVVYKLTERRLTEEESMKRKMSSIEVFCSECFEIIPKIKLNIK